MTLWQQTNCVLLNHLSQVTIFCSTGGTAITITSRRRHERPCITSQNLTIPPFTAPLITVQKSPTSCGLTVAVKQQLIFDKQQVNLSFLWRDTGRTRPRTLANFTVPVQTNEGNYHLQLNKDHWLLRTTREKQRQHPETHIWHKCFSGPATTIENPPPLTFRLSATVDHKPIKACQ